MELVATSKDNDSVNVFMMDVKDNYSGNCKILFFIHLDTTLVQRGPKTLESRHIQWCFVRKIQFVLKGESHFLRD